MQQCGLLVIFSIFTLWLVVTTLAWILLIAAVGAVEEAATGIPASLWQVIYFTGVTITSLGNGQFVATSGVGQAATVLAALNGLVLLTLSVTWLIPVLAAVAEKRQLAALINGLGNTPQQVMTALFGDRAGLGGDSLLIDLAGRVEKTTQFHHSYPVLHYFHSHEPRTALAPSIARLDDALMLAINTQPPAERLGPAVPLLRRMTAGFLDAISPTFMTAAEVAPPVPAAGYDTRADADPIGWEHWQKRRQHLKGFVESDGWTWDDVVSPAEDCPGR